jgi:hypothetical protein
VVPAANLTTAALTAHSRVHAARTLAGLAAGLRGDAPLLSPQAWPTAPAPPDAALPPMPPATGRPGEPTAAVAARVAAVRAAAADRWSGQPWATNAQATGDALRAALARTPTSRLAPLRNLIAAGALTARGGVCVLRLAFTVADLAGHGQPTADNLAEAIWLRTGRPGEA